MKQKVLETIKKYNLIKENDKIVVAVSGGPDSIAMLKILIDLKKEGKIKAEFYVSHINHMIREEAESDEEYVRKFCKKNGILFFVKRIDVVKMAKESKKGLEETGRKVRYDFFDEVMGKVGANKIAIAHNLNDKIETIFMNIMRGSGINGLKGIEPLKNNKYIRPLIECERYEIEKYCEEEKLNPRIDKTNFDNTYTRNNVRNIVIPYIKEEFNPNIIKTIKRLSELVIEEEEYFEKEVKKIYNEIVIKESKIENKKEIILDLKKFNLQEKVIKSKLLIYTITRLFGSANGIEKIHIEDIIKLCNNNIGNKYLRPNKNTKIYINKGQLFIIDER